MLEWMSEHQELLNLLVNLGMLAVWIAYLQLFLANFRKQRRPNILINFGAGSGLSARCLVSNMSSEAIYIESIIAKLEGDGTTQTCAVTDLEDLGAERVLEDPKQGTRQGPLASGGYMDIGEFRDLIERVLRSNGTPDDGRPPSLVGGRVFELQVIANYGSENLLVGGERRFDLVERQGQLSLRPRGIDTRQITTRRERRRIARTLREHL